MHEITAAIIDGRLYEIGRRCSHPFLDRTDGAVVTGIDSASPKGCTAVVEVTFDDDTKVTTALTGAVLCWQPASAPSQSPADSKKSKLATRSSGRKTRSQEDTSS